MTATVNPPAHETAGDAVRRSATLDRTRRRDLGRDRRRDVPLESHATVPTERADPIATLTAQDVSRRSELVPIRHGRMSVTAFTFYRGAAAVMASDLSRLSSSGLWVQLCGDAHLSNFGLFNGPDRRLVFDLNDFDETLPGPFEWDVKRLAASILVAARDNDIDPAKGRRAVLAAVAAYRDVMTKAADADPLGLHYFRIEVDHLVERLRAEQRKRTSALADKARSKNTMRAVSKLTRMVDGRLEFVDDPPLISRLTAHEEHRADDIDAFYEGYLRSLPLPRRRVLERYAVVDVARKVVGVGSVGTRCLIVLCQTADGDALMLQFKEAGPSVLEPYLGHSSFTSAGERVVQGQRLMQAAGDVFLGWSTYRAEHAERPVDFYFRQLWDGKGSVPIEQMRSRGLRIYADVCGRALGLAHARTGDAAAIEGYLGDDATFDEAIADFAVAYADLNEGDHRRHVDAIENGTITAVRDL